VDATAVATRPRVKVEDEHMPRVVDGVGRGHVSAALGRGPVLPDADAADRARGEVRDVYEAKGWGAGTAAFIAMTSWPGA
jgi:hypothetical protein